MHTLNHGTEKYNELGMDAAVQQMDIPGLTAMFGPSPEKDKKDKNRGNFQVTFGIACGQNVGRLRQTRAQSCLLAAPIRG